MGRPLLHLGGTTTPKTKDVNGKAVAGAIATGKRQRCDLSWDMHLTRRSEECQDGAWANLGIPTRRPQQLSIEHFQSIPRVLMLEVGLRCWQG